MHRFVSQFMLLLQTVLPLYRYVAVVVVVVVVVDVLSCSSSSVVSFLRYRCHINASLSFEGLPVV